MLVRYKIAEKINVGVVMLNMVRIKLNKQFRQTLEKSKNIVHLQKEE